MIEEQPGRDWRDLQERVAAILEECGLDSDVNHPLDLARGKAVIDVYALDPTTTPPAVYLCECKRWRSHVPQGEVQAFRTIVSDSGAHVGLVISATGFQSGAFEVVRHTNVHLLEWQGFQDLFLERWCRTYWIPTLRTRVDRLASYVDPPISDAAAREAHGEPIEQAEAVGLFVLDMWGEPFNNIGAAILGKPSEPVAQEIWLRRDMYKAYLPKPAAQATSLRELLDSLLDFTSVLAAREG
jgi:Restriction endonuclease